ncbi:hypothetical protein [Tissierella sp.]|uniref:hypothetical protein n=1 Tax=Tissierella sp. TaxID=41274 RepID=UPI0028573CAF|nr:hypothetical protein [Tissierella sp.]MDR7855579.1 hypothetical protein [Tissierella sp.]
MKNKVIVILIVILAVLSTGCKKKLEDKIAEKIIEGASGGQVDIGKDITTIKSGTSTTQVGENIKWPKDRMANLPELKANINMLVEDEENILVMIYFDSLKKDDAEKFIETVKKLNYEEIVSTSSGEGFMYSGKDEDGSEVVFSYTFDGAGSLSYSDKPYMFGDNPDGEDSAGQFTGDYIGDPASDEDIDMTDDVPWPEDFFKGIPELEGKIIEVSSGSPEDKFVYVEYVAKEDAFDYLEKLKEAGFADTPSESTSGSYVSYEASNEKGDYIVFTWSDNESATISLVKAE